MHFCTTKTTGPEYDNTSQMSAIVIFGGGSCPGGGGKCPTLVMRVSACRPVADIITAAWRGRLTGSSALIITNHIQRQPVQSVNTQRGNGRVKLDNARKIAENCRHSCPVRSKCFVRGESAILVFLVLRIELRGGENTPPRTYRMKSRGIGNCFHD